jgi:hypothetical protein
MMRSPARPGSFAELQYIQNERETVQMVVMMQLPLRTFFINLSPLFNPFKIRRGRDIRLCPPRIFQCFGVCERLYAYTHWW